TPARWASKASCRSGWARATSRAARVIGSRARTQSTPAAIDHAAGGGGGGLGGLGGGGFGGLGGSARGAAWPAAVLRLQAGISARRGAAGRRRTQRSTRQEARG